MYMIFHLIFSQKYRTYCIREDVIYYMIPKNQKLIALYSRYKYFDLINKQNNYYKQYMQ